MSKDISRHAFLSCPKGTIFQKIVNGEYYPPAIRGRTVYDRLQRYNLKGRTITLKIKYGDFKQITRNQSYPYPVGDYETIVDAAKQLLAATEPEDKRIRLLGITLSNFNEAPQSNDKPHPSGQLSLFELEE